MSDRPASPRPALYMVWEAGADRHSLTAPQGYEVSTIADTEHDVLRPVVELGGALTDTQWDEFTDRILPNGLFAARAAATREPIGVIAAIHNPRGGRFFFPGGGELGYLMVDEAHRGHGLGRALVAAAVERLRSAGYRNIWLGVQEWRLPAIRTYLDAGFVPFLHAPDPEALGIRWRDVYGQLGRALDTSRWRRELAIP